MTPVWRFVSPRPSLRMARSPALRRQLRVRAALEALRAYEAWRRAEGPGPAHYGEVDGVPYRYHGSEEVQPLIEEMVRAAAKQFGPQEASEQA